MRMLERFCPDGPGGRDCACCGQPPGRMRAEARRAQRRRERNEWRRRVSRFTRLSG